MHDIVIGWDTLNPNLENYSEGSKEIGSEFIVQILINRLLTWGHGKITRRHIKFQPKCNDKA